MYADWTKTVDDDMQDGSRFQFSAARHSPPLSTLDTLDTSTR